MDHDQATRAQFRDVEETDLAPHADSAGRLPERVGAFRVVRELGSGGMGTVYEAVQDRPRRTVALKLLKPGKMNRAVLRRFELEAELLARLDHENVARVFAAGTHQPGPGGDSLGPTPFIAMEFVAAGLSITEWAREKSLGVAERVRLFGQVCAGVAHGHAQGIVHRDLKPDNVLVGQDGRVKIIDFGVARATDSDVQLASLCTEVGQLLGTVQYMSPEQCAADPAAIDARSDVYALGVVLYELLTGSLPYDVRRLPVYEAARIVRETEAPSAQRRAPGLSSALDAILRTCLAKDKSARYADAAALGADLDRCARGEPILARPPSTFERLRARVARNPVPAAAIAALAAVIGIAVLLVTSIHRELAAATAAQKVAEVRASAESENAAAARRELASLKSDLAGFVRTGQWQLGQRSSGPAPRVVTLDAPSPPYVPAAPPALRRAPPAAPAVAVDVMHVRDRLERLADAAAAPGATRAEVANVQIEVAKGFELLGDALETGDSTATSADEAAAFGRSLALTRSALAIDSSGALHSLGAADQDPSGIWRAAQREGRLLAKMRDYAGAKVALEAALAACCDARSRDPDDETVLADVAGIGLDLGDLAWRCGAGDQARLQYEQVIALCRAGSPALKPWLAAAIERRLALAEKSGSPEECAEWKKALRAAISALRVPGPPPAG